MSNPSKTTVMNAEMAIRKKTLKLVPIKKKEFFLTFNYDCVKEIEITIFLFVTEKADHMLITKELPSVNKNLKAPPFIQKLPGGKNVTFPQSFSIDFEAYPHNLYFDSKENYYPMVIKMVNSLFLKWKGIFGLFRGESMMFRICCITTSSFTLKTVKLEWSSKGKRWRYLIKSILLFYDNRKMEKPMK